MNIHYSEKQQNKSGKTLFSVIFLLFGLFPNSVLAHFLWLDPIIQEVKEGQQTVRLYFGEYHENLFESKATRLAEREAATLTAHLPGAEEATPISLSMENNFFAGKIKTDKSGLVNLVAEDVNSPVVDWSKHGIGVVRPTYYARTQWLFFKDTEISKRVPAPIPVTELDIIPITQHFNPRTGDFGPGTGEEVVFQVYFQQKPLDQKPKSVYVYAPNGWMWEAKLDKQGVSRFKPLWPGTYVVEVIYKEVTPGEFKGEKYEAIRHRATLSLTARE